jgi:hypothetical protein
MPQLSIANVLFRIDSDQGVFLRFFRLALRFTGARDLSQAFFFLRRSSAYRYGASPQRAASVRQEVFPWWGSDVVGGRLRRRISWWF